MTNPITQEIENANLQDTAWDRWIDLVERGAREIGLPGVDCDDNVEGYSLDMLYSLYREGKPPLFAVSQCEMLFNQRVTQLKTFVARHPVLSPRLADVG